MTITITSDGFWIFAVVAVVVLAISVFTIVEALCNTAIKAGE